MIEPWVAGDLFEADAIHAADLAGIGFFVAFAEIDFIHPVGAEHLGAAGTRLSGAGDKLDSFSGEQAAEVDLGVEHVFLAIVAVVPETLMGLESRRQAIVGGSDDSVVEVDGNCADFPERVFGPKTGDMSESHGVFGNGDAILVHAFFFAHPVGVASFL